MRAKSLIISIIALMLVSAVFHLLVVRGRIDKRGSLNKAIAPVFLKFGLTDNRLVKKTVEESKLAGDRYISSYLEYDVPDSFTWRYFEAALNFSLKNTGFIVFDTERSFEKDKECYTVIIKYGKFDILTFKINRKGRPAKRMIEKVHAHPKVAIVIDDFGYSKNNLDVFFGLKQTFTLAILPEQRFTREVADMAKARGFETILHLPLESDNDHETEEADTIRVGMSEREILLRLKKEIESVPGIDGVSNHMGSKATADTAVMTTVMRHLKLAGLYFFDSLTSSRSVCGEVASALGVRHAKRDMFLDNSSNTIAIEKQMEDLKVMAFKRGSAIAIGHDRKNTAAVLARVMPEMAREGIVFVRLSELVKK